MSDILKVSYGNESNLPTKKTNGQIYFCQDTGNMYLDLNDERHIITSTKYKKNSNNGDYPLLLANSTSPTDGSADIVTYANQSTTINPWTGEIKAPILNAISGMKYKDIEVERTFISMIPYGTQILANANLNTAEFMRVGNYFCRANTDAETLTNSPTEKAFMMQVYSPLSTDIDNESGTWVYRIRKLQDYRGPEYIQYSYTNDIAGNWIYGDWVMVIKSNNLASEESAGIMTADDKKKLNGISSGANKYTLPTASSSVLGGIKIGDYLTISSDGKLSGNYSIVTQQINGLMSAADKAKLDGIAENANNYTYTLPIASSTVLGGVKIGTNITISDGKISVPTASDSVQGVTVVHPAPKCTTFTSDSGAVTPLAAQKAAKMFSITRPQEKENKETTTNNNIVRWDGTSGDVKDSKIKIEDVTNTRDTSKKAQVISIPADNGKKMVYGYCTDQVDGTSFIGGLFDADATSFPYADGLAIGGSTGNLLWKNKRVVTADELITTNATAQTNGFMSASDKAKLDKLPSKLLHVGDNPPEDGLAILWIQTNSNSGGLKYYSEDAQNWVHVPVAWV